jgi:hypothetical protein
MSTPLTPEAGLSAEVAAIVSDWLTVLRSLPDPPPDLLLSEVQDAAIVVAISALAESSSTELQREVKAALAPVARKALRAKAL